MPKPLVPGALQRLAPIRQSRHLWPQHSQEPCATLEHRHPKTRLGIKARTPTAMPRSYSSQIPLVCDMAALKTRSLQCFGAQQAAWQPRPASPRALCLEVEPTSDTRTPPSLFLGSAAGMLEWLLEEPWMQPWCPQPLRSVARPFPVLCPGWIPPALRTRSAALGSALGQLGVGHSEMWCCGDPPERLQLIQDSGIVPLIAELRWKLFPVPALEL